MVVVVVVVVEVLLLLLGHKAVVGEVGRGSCSRRFVVVIDSCQGTVKAIRTGGWGWVHARGR
jgi:hypothetical protein